MENRRSSYHFLRSGWWLPLALCCCLCGCVQSYVSPYKAPQTGYLVVEGYISGNSVTQFSLTRTIPLPGDSTLPVVTGAQLQVEGTDNSVYPLSELGGGLYAIGSLPLSTAVQYRLRTIIPGGETYLSEFVPYKPTPPIDSINWIQNGAGVTIFANTHDPTNSTRYYQWTFDQTYEYTAAEYSGYYYDTPTNTVQLRSAAQQVFYCWKDIPPTSIVLGTSAQLAQDVIYEFPLVNIPPNSQELTDEYSILVTQYALTDSGYDFLSQMAATTQALGSIFDAQPSQLTGNIHSLSNSTEPVIGYIQAGTVQQQRIFISTIQLKNWVYYNTCPQKDIDVPPIPDSLLAYFGGEGYVPLYYKYPPPPDGWVSNQAECVDCRLQGGTTVKPAFWPN
ncbi:MAG TPA: DUF4249 domain-containing protein [Puia sp.]|nr:DUF4249 domain-containing protein [Puia sp.]